MQIDKALSGVKFKFVARSCNCGTDIAAIHASLEFHCISCGASRGALTLHTAQFLERIVGNFGRPNHPIILRRNPA
jgi:hypothetical protein